MFFTISSLLIVIYPPLFESSSLKNSKKLALSPDSYIIPPNTMQLNLRLKVPYIKKKDTLY